jgi:Protein of unknown function (DUF3775)
MRKLPHLSISPEKLFFIVSKARRSDIIATGTEFSSDLRDDDTGSGTEDYGKDTDRLELSGFIQGLNVDEQIDLVALTWLGRGDDDLESWHDLRAEALRAHNNRTARYLRATPMLADYLEEALSRLKQILRGFRRAPLRASKSGRQHLEHFCGTKRVDQVAFWYQRC